MANGKPADAPDSNTNIASSQSGPDDVLDNIDSMLDEDAEMYDDGDAGVDAGVGDDTGDGDSGGDGSVQSRASDEPPLPMAMPDARAPAQPAYDPDNPKGYARVGSLFADKDGNIVTRDGRVMAAKGEPARHWSNLSRQAAQATAFQKQADTLNRQIEQNKPLIEAAKELADLPNRLGVSREDYNLGVQLIAQWNQDPLTMCREMVAKTMARGFNATDIIGKEAGNAIEMSALRQLINEATAGQRQREEMDRTVAQNRGVAQQRYDAFMGRYPDAGPHADAIADLMASRKISAEEAYHEIRFFSLQHGLDFSQPLGPQVAARQQNNAPPAPQPNGRTQRAPMVNGGGGGSRDHLTNNTVYADANSSWSEILNSVITQSA